MYNLANGNSIPKLRYDALWLPVKGKILPEHSHQTLDPRHVKGTIHKKPRH